MDNCIFCKIVLRQIPATVVYEDDELMAFNDINPAAPVHLLIIPKIHVESLASVETKHTELLGKMLILASKLAREHGCDLVTDADGNRTGGYKTVIHTGPHGGQVVYHLHMHVIGGIKP